MNRREPARLLHPPKHSWDSTFEHYIQRESIQWKKAGARYGRQFSNNVSRPLIRNLIFDNVYVRSFGASELNARKILFDQDF